MNRRSLRAAILAALSFVIAVPAFGGRVFLSTRDDDPFGHDFLVTGPGQDVTLYIWWQPDRGEVINGASIDIVTNNPGVLDVTASTVLNPIAGPFGPRYNGAPNPGNVNPDDPLILIEGMLGVSVNATGIDAAINDFGNFDTTFVGGNLLYGSFTVHRDGFCADIAPAMNRNNPITAEGLGAVDVEFHGLRMGFLGAPSLFGSPRPVANGGFVSLQPAINDRSGSLANAIRLSTDDGSSTAEELAPVTATISNDEFGLFGAAIDGDDVDLTFDLAASRALPFGTYVSADLLIEAANGCDRQLRYTLVATTVPEPGAMLLASASAIACGMMRRGKRQP